MGWLIFSVFAVAATFAVTFFSSGDIWDAMFAAAIPVALFLVGLLVRATRQGVSRRQRMVILSSVVVLSLGVAGHWVVMHSMTRDQHEALIDIRDRMQRSIMVSALYDRATPVFGAFHSQHFPENRSMTEIFADYHPALLDRGAPVLLDSLDGGVRVYAKSAWNAMVVLTSVGGVGRGMDPEFTNIDGRHGFLQSCLRLTPEGMVYEIQN
jgi:hypothetical protein